MISVSLVGKREFFLKLDRMPPAVKAALLLKMRGLALRLQAHIQRNKLSGQVLNVVTGALRRSIFQIVQDFGDLIQATVYSSSDVKYARIQELGGHTKAHIIRPRKAEALSFMMNGGRVFAREVHHPGSLIPARPFMSTGLADMATTIQTEMKQTVVTALLREQGR